MSTLLRLAVVSAALSSAVASPVLAQGRPTRAQQQQQAAMSEIPKCAQKLGTLSITNGDAAGWRTYNLASPEKLLKVIVQQSGCFDLVDRGAGLNAAQTERDIGGNLGLQRGSNVGSGQIKAADYVLVAEVVAKNNNAGGNALAGAAGGLIGGTAGALIGGIRTTRLEANTVLSLTSVRTTETVAVEEGYYLKTDIGWGAGGGAYFGGFAGAVGGGYENTDIGKVVTIAFVNAYAKLVNDLGSLPTGGVAQASPQRSFAAVGQVTMRRSPDASGASIRTLPDGTVVYPTGNRQDLWWEVADENDNVGWVLNTRLAPK